MTPIEQMRQCNKQGIPYTVEIHLRSGKVLAGPVVSILGEWISLKVRHELPEAIVLVKEAWVVQSAIEYMIIFRDDEE